MKMCIEQVLLMIRKITVETGIACALRMHRKLEKRDTCYFSSKHAQRTRDMIWQIYVYSKKKKVVIGINETWFYQEWNV